MNDQETVVLEFFRKIALKDELTLSQLADVQRLRVETDGCHFTLPDLYGFLCEQEASLAGLEYRQFRQLVFRTPINKMLKALGTEVVLANGEATVDQSTYYLSWAKEARNG